MVKVKVQISSCIHEENPKILEAWLDGISGLTIPPDCEISWKFILHEPFGYESSLIEQYLPDAVVKVLRTDIPAAPVSDVTHQWSIPLIAIVSSAKNDLIREALNSGVDYLFFCDSDMILRPQTLTHLIEQEKDWIGCVSWTQWQLCEPARPNCWDQDHYSFHLDTMEKLRKPGVYKTGFVGGCHLVSRKVLEAGVNYTGIHNLTFKLEDRFFGIRAAVMGFQAYISTVYPSLHLYREADLERLEGWKAGQEVV